MGQKPSSLYIHIPFCAQKCAYCDFVSFADPEFRKEYIELLCKEIRMIGTHHNKPTLKTIFVGGGTPSLLKVDEIKTLGKNLKRYFDMTQIVEFSFETNPGTVELEALKMWREIGANRISMGVQSMNNQLLGTLGRIHTADIVESSFNIIRESGFDNVNLDIMFGLPNQKVDDMLSTVDAVLDLGPEHISAYSLKVEEGTPFDKMVDAGKLVLPSEEEDRAMYHGLVEKLAYAGLSQYEISNFSKPNLECQHNLVYWRGEEYFAAGMSAHGYVNGHRQGNFIDWLTYKDYLTRGEFPIMTEEEIDLEDAAFEFIMLGLRLNKGVDLNLYKERFNKSFESEFADVIQVQLEQGLIENSDGFVSLTKHGRDTANSVIVEYMK